MKLRLMFLLPVLAVAPVASAQSLSTEAQQLWDVVSCKSDKPSVDVPNYAKYCQLLAAEQATYQQRVGEKAKVFFKDKRPTDLPTTELYPFSGADVVSSLAVGAVVVLRRRRGNTAPADSYRTFAYPVTPFVFLVSSLGVLTLLLYEGKTAAWGGVGILAGALLAGWLWTRATRI